MGFDWQSECNNYLSLHCCPKYIALRYNAKQEEETQKLAWTVEIACWLYFLTAIFLYIYFGFKWVNTFDVSFALLIAFSVWYVLEKSRGPGKSRWVIGWMGLHRWRSEGCQAKQRK